MANEFVSFEKLKLFLENIKTKTISPIVKTLSNRISALEQRGGGGGGTQVNFVPRTNTSKAPEKGNKYWTNTAYGGLNPYQVESSEGSVLPNCVAYVYGRLLEINDQCHPETIWYPQLDGWKYYDTCKKNGIPVDPNIPKEGAIACWEDSTRSLGHVAMVESVSKDGNTYNINYTDSWSDHPEHSYYYGATSSDSDYYFSGGAWKFIGFVYAVELSETPIQDLAKVAYTGEYSDLLNSPVIPDEQINSDWNATSGKAKILNKPTIPAAQIQSDWNQTDPTKKDFIKNKPIIPPSANDSTAYGFGQIGNDGVTTAYAHISAHKFASGLCDLTIGFRVTAVTSGQQGSYYVLDASKIASIIGANTVNWNSMQAVVTLYKPDGSFIASSSACGQSGLISYTVASDNKVRFGRYYYNSTSGKWEPGAWPISSIAGSPYLFYGQLTITGATYT